MDISVHTVHTHTWTRSEGFSRFPLSPALVEDGGFAIFDGSEAIILEGYPHVSDAILIQSGFHSGFPLFLPTSIRKKRRWVWQTRDE